MLARRVASRAAASTLRRTRADRRQSLAFASRVLSTASPETTLFTSPHGFIDIPNKTIWDIAEEQAAANADRNAFICGLKHKSLTFGELAESAKRLAIALAQDGVRKGDVRADGAVPPLLCGV